MAVFNKSLSLLAFTTTLFFMLLNNVYSNDITSFTYTGFSQGRDKLIFQGVAKVNSDNNLDLTQTSQRSVGRVLYSDEIQLWERGTSRVSTIETSIGFSLTAASDNNPADGFTFFIAPPDSTIPQSSYGGYLGLFSPSTALDPSRNQVVAVEFDTFTGNSWDPNYRHLGIDVNTIRSSVTARWGRQEGAIGNVRINYNSNTRNLTVVTSYPGGEPIEVFQIVDLRATLPERVRVGLSASTGDHTQVHTVHSWNFVSSLVYTRTRTKDEDNMYISSVV
ncbi:hypothetical protein RIF29_18243 [Crotalaria pallida]|uniref:Legume lectin domain-containing protein n=1 Tax=Crotalaria pallida TaxID=3830 RepID=A0AAN9FQH4_CROPI